MLDREDVLTVVDGHGLVSPAVIHATIMSHAAEAKIHPHAPRYQGGCVGVLVRSPGRRVESRSRGREEGLVRQHTGEPELEGGAAQDVAYRITETSRVGFVNLLQAGDVSRCRGVF